MSVVYDQLRTLAFHLREGRSIPDPFWTLGFPETWKGPLLDLQAEQSGRPSDRNNIPVRTLNAAMRALVPDLISISPDAGRFGQGPWIYSANKIDAKYLDPIVRAWVRTEFSRASEASRERALAQIRAEDLVWQPEEVDLASWGVGPNGCARPTRGDIYTLLPDYLASCLSRGGLRFEFGDGPRALFRALGDPWTRGAEVISWSPFVYGNANGDWPFSAVLRFTVQTVPFEARPAIHCHVSLRRWASVPIRKLMPGNTSVYLRTEVPWLNGTEQTHTFQVAPITRGRLGADANGEPRWGFVWGSDLAPLFGRLARGGDLPAAEALCANPAAYLNPHGMPNFALDYRVGMWPEHGVGPGWGPTDRGLIFEQVAEALGEVLDPCPSLSRVHVPVRAPKRVDQAPSTKRTQAASQTNGRTAEQQHQVRKLVGLATDNALNVDVLYQSDDLWRAIVAAITADLGLAAAPTGSLTDELRWDTDEGFSLTLRPQVLGALGADLVLDRGGNPDDRLRSAIAARCAELAGRLPPVKKGSAAIIEIAPAETFATGADPKFALRLGAARSGRLTQFLQVFDASLDLPRAGKQDGRLQHRAMRAWRDLLRQLGVQLVRPAFTVTEGSIPEPLNFLAIWLIKQNRPTARTRFAQQIPVMVWATSDTDEVLATAPGLSGFMPYREALLQIAGLDAFERRGRDEGRTAQWIEQTMNDHVRGNGDVLLMTEAHNLRAAWPWLQNGRVQHNYIQFGVAPPVPIERWPGLRHVQIRTSDNGETPDCFGEADNRRGFPKGFWEMGTSGWVFGSTAGTPDTQQESPGRSKLRPWQTIRSEAVRKPQPRAAMWNPRLLEVAALALQPGDVSEVWTGMAHEMRFMASHFDDPLVLPVYLHLASLMEEYVLPMQGASAQSET